MQTKSYAQRNINNLLQDINKLGGGINVNAGIS